MHVEMRSFRLQSAASAELNAVGLIDAGRQTTSAHQVRVAVRQTVFGVACAAFTMLPETVTPPKQAIVFAAGHVWALAEAVRNAESSAIREGRNFCVVCIVSSVKNSRVM